MDDSYSLNVNIVTPDRQLFGAEVFSAVLPGANGEIEILPGHQAIITALKMGPLVIHYGDKEINLFYVGDGFAEVRGNNLTVLVSEANHYGELDRTLVMEEFSTAAKLLAEAKDEETTRLAQKSLARAESRKEILNLIRNFNLPDVTPAISDT